LIDNAERHGPQGGAICIALERRQNDAVFSVVDDGTGIPVEDRERILAGGPARTGGTARIGLGLPVARTIAELHRGRVWVDDRPVGTAFCFALPIAQEATATAQLNPSSEVANR
jgi:signal transduction histidine kinase